MGEDKERKSLEYWSGRAPEYSQLHMDSYLSSKRMMFAEQVAESMPAFETIDALDLGCGTGFMSLLLLDAGCRVTGIDFSDEMLSLARRNVAEKGYKASFLHMKAQKLEFPDESFDFVVSRNVTWTLENVDVVYAEVMRVLRDGGVFLNLDANYGASFNAADERGEAPTHPTQTIEQLRLRNDIAHDLAITLADRPSWDVATFWRLGAGEVRCRRIGEGQNVSGSQMFALEVHKHRDETLTPTHLVTALETASQQPLSESGESGAAGIAGMADAGDRRDGAPQPARVMLVDYVRVGDFAFDPRKFVVRKGGVPISLTPKEFNILLTLARSPKMTVSQAELARAAWGSDFTGKPTDLAVYIRRIRAKVEDDPSRPCYILTRWGKGYAFDPDGAQEK